MAQNVQYKMVKMVLVGGQEGKSGHFGGFDFVKGEAEVPEHCQDAIRMLGSLFSAYPAGSKEAEAAEEAYLEALEEANKEKAKPKVLSKMTVDELKQHAKKTYGKNIDGNKLQLLQQMEELANEAAAADADDKE